MRFRIGFPKRQLALMAAMATAAGSGPVHANEAIISPEIRKDLEYVMIYAAETDPSVRRVKTQIQATQVQVVVPWLNSLQGYFTAGETQYHDPNDIMGTSTITYLTPVRSLNKKGQVITTLVKNTATVPDRLAEQKVNSYTSTMGFRIVLQAQTPFQSYGQVLNKQVQEQQLLALQMQLATQAGTDYLTYAAADHRLKFLKYAAGKLSRISKELAVKLKTADTAVQNAAQAKKSFQALPDKTPAAANKVDAADVAAKTATTQAPSAQGLTSLQTEIDRIKGEVITTQGQANDAMIDLGQFIPPGKITELKKRLANTNSVDAQDLFERGRFSVDPSTSIPLHLPKLEDAIAMSKTAPVIVQAQLNQSQAQNSFWTEAAQLAPTLTGGYGCDHTGGETEVTGSLIYTGVKKTDGCGINVTIAENVSPGRFATMYADHLQVDAEGDALQKTILTVTTDLQRGYNDLDFDAQNVVAQAELIGTAAPALQKYLNEDVHSNPGDLSAIVQTLTRVDSANQSVTNSYRDYFVTQIRIRAEIGDLLSYVGADTQQPNVAIKGSQAFPDLKKPAIPSVPQ